MTNKLFDIKKTVTYEVIFKAVSRNIGKFDELSVKLSFENDFIRMQENNGTFDEYLKGAAIKKIISKLKKEKYTYLRYNDENNLAQLIKIKDLEELNENI